MSDEVTVSVSGSVTKAVACAGCGAAYFYRMTRKTSATRGTGFNSAKAENKAREAAETRLRERLEKEVDPVPCPTCGDYQPDMFEGLGRKKFRGLRWAAVTLFVLACPALFMIGVSANAPAGTPANPPTELWVGLAVVLFVGSVIALVMYKSKKNGYDPNAGPSDDRLVIARQKAVTAEAIDRAIQQMEASPDQPPPFDATKPWQKGAGS